MLSSHITTSSATATTRAQGQADRSQSTSPSKAFQHFGGMESCPLFGRKSRKMMKPPSTAITTSRIRGANTEPLPLGRKQQDPAHHHAALHVTRTHSFAAERARSLDRDGRRPHLVDVREGNGHRRHQGSLPALDPRPAAGSLTGRGYVSESSYAAVMVPPAFPVLTTPTGSMSSACTSP